MSRPSTDPHLTPLPVRAARPLIDAFMRSGRCPEEHRFHARSSLPLLALFLAMTEEQDSRGLPWHRLTPDALVGASLEQDDAELGFLRDLLDVAAAFYGYLAERGVIRREEAHPIRRRLTELALAFAHS